MISVVIPLYNKIATIRRAIETVLAQSYNDYEIIVVDDGSTDGSFTEVAKFRDSRISVITQQNAGVSAARNRGISEARGEYIAFLDADDEWRNDYLATQVRLAAEYPEAAVFATNYKFRKENGVESQTILRNMPFMGEAGILTNYFEVASTSHPPLWTSAVMARRDALLAVGGFPVGIKSGEDLLTWARLAYQNKIAYSRLDKATYNLGEGYDYSKLPPRKQDIGDPVGRGLKEILSHNRHIPGLKMYISHWHKMRASVAIRYGDRLETVKETIKSVYYNPFNYKVYPFIVLSLVHKHLRQRIISNYKR